VGDFTAGNRAVSFYDYRREFLNEALFREIAGFLCGLALSHGLRVHG
jgi:hypothetical protein